MDLTTGWDFSRKADRKEARRLINLHRPVLVIASPPCTVYSLIRNLSDTKRSPDVVHHERVAARTHQVCYRNMYIAAPGWTFVSV